MKHLFLDRRQKIGAVGIVLLLTVITILLPQGIELKITSIEDNRVLLVLPLKEGERFTIHYYHSVENSPIWEEHRVDENGTIFIEEERYLKVGAGMGRLPGVGRMVKKGEFEAIEDMHQPVGNFVLRVGSVGVDHTVIWRDKRVNLSENFSHQAVQFTARPVSGIYYLWRTVVPHSKTPK